VSDVTHDRSDHAATAERLEDAVGSFAETMRRTASPTHGPGVLVALRAVQAALVELYSTLASDAADETSNAYDAGDDEAGGLRNPGWDRVRLALEEAAQYGRDATAAIDRARNADEVAVWFDEVEADEGV